MSRHSSLELKKCLGLPCWARWPHSSSSSSASMRLIKSYSSDSAKIMDRFSQVPRKNWCHRQSLNRKKTLRGSQRAHLLCWAWNWVTIWGRTRTARAAWWDCPLLDLRAIGNHSRICLSWSKKKRWLTMHTFKFRSLKTAKMSKIIRQTLRARRMITWWRLFKCWSLMKFKTHCASWTSLITQAWTLTREFISWIQTFTNL